MSTTIKLRHRIQKDELNYYGLDKSSFKLFSSRGFKSFPEFNPMPFKSATDKYLTMIFPYDVKNLPDTGIQTSLKLELFDGGIELLVFDDDTTVKTLSRKITKNKDHFSIKEELKVLKPVISDQFYKIRLTVKVQGGNEHSIIGNGVVI